MSRRRAVDKASWDHGLDVATLNDERLFMEEVLNERFNFFLIFFSLILGGAASCGNEKMVKVILILGFVICLLLSLTIYRAFRKMRALFRELKSREPTHAASWVDRRTHEDWTYGPSVIPTIGVVIPLVCTLALAALWVVAIMWPRAIGLCTVVCLSTQVTVQPIA